MRLPLMQSLELLRPGNLSSTISLLLETVRWSRCTAGGLGSSGHLVSFHEARTMSPFSFALPNYSLPTPAFKRPQPPWVRACLYWARSVSPHQMAGDATQAADTEPLSLKVMEPLICSCSINDIILPTCWTQKQPASAHWEEGDETHSSNKSIPR